MAILKVRDAIIDPLAKMALTELRDSFGGAMIVQTSILSGDHDADVVAAATLMSGNEQAFITKLIVKLGVSSDEIAAMQVAPDMDAIATAQAAIAALAPPLPPPLNV